jgi:hypothetical protein
LSHTLFSVKTTTKGEANRPIRELAEVIIEWYLKFYNLRLINRKQSTFSLFSYLWL